MNAAWRFLDLSFGNAFDNMALDEALAVGAAKGTSPPTIRLYKWKPSAVSFGYYQRMSDAFNAEKCKELGVDCVRRLTGGASVYHDFQGDVTYSVTAPEALVPKGLLDSYSLVCSALMKALSSQGIHSSIGNSNDLMVKGRKVSGNAQTRRDGYFLQHGTIIYDFDPELNLELLTLEKPSKERIESLKSRVASVRELNPSATQAGVVKAIKSSFQEVFGCVDGTLSKEEKSKMRELSMLKYSLPKWNDGSSGEEERGPCYF